MIYSKIGKGEPYTFNPAPRPPAAKFASQDDAHVRIDAQIKFLYYPLNDDRDKCSIFVGNLGPVGKTNSFRASKLNKNGI